MLLRAQPVQPYPNALVAAKLHILALIVRVGTTSLLPPLACHVLISTAIVLDAVKILQLVLNVLKDFI